MFQNHYNYTDVRYGWKLNINIKSISEEQNCHGMYADVYDKAASEISAIFILIFCLF